MDRIHLRIRKKHRFKFIIMVIALLVLAIQAFNSFSKKINRYFYQISSIQATKLSKVIINQAINKTILDYIDTEELFLVQKNEKGNIKSVDFNVKEQNKLLLLINSNVTNYLKELENGKSSIVDIRKSIVTNNYISRKKGVFLEIPIGIVFDNVFLANISPKIPIKFSLNGEVFSKIKTEVENYGINNSLLKVYIEIEVTEQIILPRISKSITIKSTIPIALKMIQGEIPNYYLGNQIENKQDY